MTAHRIAHKRSGGSVNFVLDAAGHKQFAKGHEVTNHQALAESGRSDPTGVGANAKPQSEVGSGSASGNHVLIADNGSVAGAPGADGPASAGDSGGQGAPAEVDAVSAGAIAADSGSPNGSLEQVSSDHHDGVSPFLIIGGLAAVGGIVAVAASGHGGTAAAATPAAPAFASATQSATGAENAASVNLTATATNATSYAASAPSHGTATVSSSGAVTYAPNQFYYGTDTFTVTATGSGGTATQTETITVTQTLPTFASATVTGSGNENAPIVLTESSANTVVSGATATYTVPASGTGAPAHGTVTISGGTVTYTPTQFYVGSDSFVVTLSDGHGGTTTQTENVTVAQVLPTITAATSGLTVAEAGTPGISTTGSISGSTITTSVTDAIATTVVSGATATVTVSTQGAHGTATYANGVVTYDPNPYYSGSDSFVIAVGDGHGGVANETINVTVTHQTFTDTVAIASNATATASSYTDGLVQVTNGDNYVYAVADTQSANAIVTNFHVGTDTISVGGATTAAQWSYSSDAAGDLIVTHTTGGISEEIILDHVVTGSAVIYNYASAEAALGYDFMHFGGSTGSTGNNAGISITNGNLNPAGINPNGPAVTTDGGSGHIAYTLNEASATNVAITHFANGDTIAVSNGSPGDYSFGTANNGHDIVIDHTNGATGVTSVVTLVNADPTGAFVDNLATAEAVLGYNFMTTASAGPAGSVNLPSGLAGLTTVPLEISNATLVTSAGNTNFVDNITTDAAIIINNFSANDTLDFSGGSAAKVSYSSIVTDSSGKADLLVTYSVGNGHTNEVVLHDAINATAFVFDAASAQQAVGHNFVTFA